MHAFADLDDRPDEPWHICPRDASPDSEEDRQFAFLKLARYRAPSLIIWATPNAGRRTRWEIAKAHREGLKAGALDLQIFWNHGCAVVEFKNGKEGPSGNQRDMLNDLYRAGHKTGVFRTADALFAKLIEWGAPVR